MSAAAARGGAPAIRAISALPWSPGIARLSAFAALAAFATAHWARLVVNPPMGRLAVAVLVATAGGAVLARYGGRPERRAARLALSAGIALATLITVLSISGLPLRLLLPGGWNELGDGLNRGLGGIESVQWAYDGDDPWIRLSVMLGAPLMLGLAAAATFWPGRGRAGSVVGLVLLLLLYGVSVTEYEPGEPLLRGLALLLLVAAWLWLPRMSPREAAPAAVLVLAVGLLAMPVAAKLNADQPWWDYRGWDWFGGGRAVAFSWDHSYGPLDWPRDGTTLLNVRSERPHYWKAETLDRFDGLVWRRSRDGTARATGELPDSLQPQGSTWNYYEYNPRWDEQIRFTVRSLRTDFIVGAGTTYSVRGAGPTAGSNDGTTIVLDEPLERGDSYTVRSYDPDPSAEQMRGAPAGYPAGLAAYTAMSLPRPGETALRRPDRDGVFDSSDAPAYFPLRGGISGFDDGDAERRIQGSPYARVYRLAQRLTAGQPTTYDAVKRVETYLERNYDYSERPPSQEYPLAAFLFEDKIGYCQQFSGAMALMLRMSGIPARVAAGFSPGSFNRDEREYRVRDLDAHSWVEVYFSGIGWVPFDPTPAAAPAELQLGTDAAAADRNDSGSVSSDRGTRSLSDRALEAGDGGPAAQSDEGPSGLLLPAVFAAALAGAGGLLVLRRVRRRRDASASALAEGQLRELVDALRRLGWEVPGGTTLLALERRLRRSAGPASGDYAALLRAHRYDARPAEVPDGAARRALRRELGGRGLRGRLRALLALPPWGPRPFSGA